MATVKAWIGTMEPARLRRGARYYDAEIGRWMCVDPLSGKFPAWSPYVYCYNSPIRVIDLEGIEGVVVSGQPGDHINNEHFLVNGLDRAKELNKKYAKAGKGEKATWIIYNSGEEGGFSSQVQNLVYFVLPAV